MSKFRDPVWRRALITIGYWLCRAGEACLNPKEAPISWRDDIGWRIESWGERVMALGLDGSNEEALMYINGDIPWETASPALQARIAERFPEYFETKEAA